MLPHVMTSDPCPYHLYVWERDQTRIWFLLALRARVVLQRTAENMALKGLLLLFVILHAVCGQSGQGTYIMVLSVYNPECTGDLVYWPMMIPA